MKAWRFVKYFRRKRPVESAIILCIGVFLLSLALWGVVTALLVFMSALGSAGLYMVWTLCEEELKRWRRNVNGTWDQFEEHEKTHETLLRPSEAPTDHLVRPANGDTLSGNVYVTADEVAKARLMVSRCGQGGPSAGHCQSSLCDRGCLKAPTEEPQS